MLEIMSGSRTPETAGQLRDKLHDLHVCGLDPEELFQLGEHEGYQVRTSWASSRGDGGYEAVFSRRRDNGKSPTPVKWPQAEVTASDLSRYSNWPAIGAYRRKLLSRLSECVREKCPWCNGIEIMLVEALPNKDESDEQC